MIDQPRVTRQSRLDGHLLYRHVDGVERRQLRRQLSDVDRIEASTIDQHGYLYAGILGQVGYQIGVGYVTVELEGFAAQISIDDVCRILIAALETERLLAGKPGFDFFFHSLSRR